MNCAEVRSVLSAHYDNELSAELRLQVEVHLAACAECTTQLAQFASLSSLAAGLSSPETPNSVWPQLKKSLELFEAREVTVRHGKEPKRSMQSANHGARRRRAFRIAAAVAASVLVALVAWTVWHGDHTHKTMVRMIEQVSNEIDSEDARNLLLNKYGGNEVSFSQAINQVGYQPIVSKGLPDGYSVENIQVLDMPCCTCTQTACRRADGTRLFIFEHGKENTGWFGHRDSRKADCCGKSCTVVQLENRMAVTWNHDGRHVTLLGIRDKEEYELLVMRFEKGM